MSAPASPPPVALRSPRRICARPFAHLEALVIIWTRCLTIRRAATRPSLLSNTLPSTRIFCPGNNPATLLLETITRTGMRISYLSSTRKAWPINEYEIGAKELPNTFGTTRLGSVVTCNSTDVIAPRNSLIALESRAAIRIDIIVAPSTMAIRRTARRLLLRQITAASTAMAETAQVGLQLCTRAPTHTAPPNARARLSIRRAASL